MAEIEPLLEVGPTLHEEDAGEFVELPASATITVVEKEKAARVASLDVFRGLSVLLMIIVDYAGALCPSISHAPWNGVHLADLVMPFFLFIVGVSVALVYKRVSNKTEATLKALHRALKLFLLGIFLQGGYFHGVNTLTYGVAVENIRFLGILQRIAIGYVVAGLCEIWLPHKSWSGNVLSTKYIWHWCTMLLLCGAYLGLLYGMYVPSWQFNKLLPESSSLISNDSFSYIVKCSVRGDLGPACNSAGMIDRYFLGINHLHSRPVYRALKECNMSRQGQFPETAPSWCHAPFDPEGILSSLSASVTCIIGLQFGHTLTQVQNHKERLRNWSTLSISAMALGLVLTILGMPLNKSLYTTSYLLVTSASAGITFCLLYLLVDVCGWKWLTCVLEWMGKHSLGIFILIASDMIIIFAQGFYLETPDNNIVQWFRKLFVHT